MTGVNVHSNPILGLFAAAALLAFFSVEYSKHEVPQDWHAQKLEAAQRAKTAAEYLKKYRLDHGVFVDATNDPNETCLIGQDMTPITTDRGYLDAKLASTNPNFAAVVLDMLMRAGVQEHDNVAIGMTGSFPAINIAVLSALETLHCSPISICSVGSSNWGANDPAYTWLDMERILNDAGILHCHSVAASIGGGADVGRGLSPEGRRMILQAIERNHAELINEELIERSISRRLSLYDRQPVKAYINIGGGIASIGAVITGEIVPDGLSMKLPVKNYPVKGVMIAMAERGIPVIHLSDIKNIWRAHGLPLNPIPLPEPGSGGIFIREKYNITYAWIAVTVLFAMIFFAGYLDRRKHRLGTEPVPVPEAGAGHEL